MKGTVRVKSMAVKQRQKDQNAAVIEFMDRAVECLLRKYHKMMYQGIGKINR